MFDDSLVERQASNTESQLMYCPGTKPLTET